MRICVVSRTGIFFGICVVCPNLFEQILDNFPESVFFAQNQVEQHIRGQNILRVIFDDVFFDFEQLNQLLQK